MRPLLILDCDEVLLQFANPFAAWLRAERQVEFRFDSHGLVGNLYRLDDGAPLPKKRCFALLDCFFAEGQHWQQPVDQAPEVLAGLSPHFDAVVLTNIPARFLEARRRHLHSFGLTFPLYANDGPKGRMVRELSLGRPAIFLDDFPVHMESVARLAPDVHRLHMVAEPRIRRLVPVAADAHARVEGWAEAGRWIRDILERMNHGR